MPQHHSLNYLEFSAHDLERTQAFYAAVFGWQFQMYGPDYCGFKDSAASEHEGGGFFRVPPGAPASATANGAALAVLWSDNLEASAAAVSQHGGTITTAIFAFPGGRRFQFTDPCGNELGVWGAP
jgi:uncharacterized protein